MSEKRRTKWVLLRVFFFVVVSWNRPMDASRIQRQFGQAMCAYFANSSIFIKASGYQKVVRAFLKSLPVRGFSSSSSSASSVSFNAKLPACLPTRYECHSGIVCVEHKASRCILFMEHVCEPMHAAHLSRTHHQSDRLLLTFHVKYIIYRIPCIVCATTVFTALNFDSFARFGVCVCEWN